MFDFLRGILIAYFAANSLFKPNDQTYCGTTYCKDPLKPHINCNNDHTLKCASNTPISSGQYRGELFQFSEQDKLDILNIHNERRNKIAGGNLVGFEPATKMIKMKWNDELAASALLNVKTCLYQHDCHNTANFTMSGQNLGYKGASLDIGDPMDKIKETIAKWFDSEYGYCNANIIRSYVKGPSGSGYGHFTVMAADRNYCVGCAAYKYRQFKDNMEWTYVGTACNYASTNVNGMPIYETGTIPGSKCLKKDTIYTSLCTENQPIDVNNPSSWYK